MLLMLQDIRCHGNTNNQVVTVNQTAKRLAISLQSLLMPVIKSDRNLVAQSALYCD